MTGQLRGGAIIFALLVCAAWTAESAAASVRLRYGFLPGSSYTVTERSHDVGKSVTTMNIMGQVQEIETPSDQVSEGRWTAKAAGGGGVVKLEATYGQHKGGERWSAEKVQSDDFFAGSRAVVTVDPLRGAVDFVIEPKDEVVQMIYRGRFSWMPVLPEGPVKEGSSFEHEYVMKSGMYNVKTTDEYVVALIKGNYVTFDVETKQVAVIRLSSAPTPEGAPPGMGMNLGDMTIAYRGKGTAVFDIKEGIFVEREGKMSYSNLEGTKGSSPVPGGMAFSTRMEGTMKYSWEMERK